MLTLSLWQISVIAAMAVIAVLIGTLVVLARALTNKVGKAYAALRRIEEVLIAANAPKGRAGALGASMEAVGSTHGPLSSEIGVRERRNREMPVREIAQREVAVPEMLLAEGAVHEMAVGGMSATDRLVSDRDRRVSYLTVRDLKVMSRSGRRRSDTEVSQEAAAQLSARLFAAVQSDADSADAPLHASHAGAHQLGGSRAGAGQAGDGQFGGEPAGADQAGAEQAAAAHADAVQADAGHAVGAGHAGPEPEPTGLSSSSAVLQELATATSEVRALLNEVAEPARAPTAAAVSPDEAVAEAHEEMYAYSELSSAPVHRAAPEPELRTMSAWEPALSREPTPTERASEPAAAKVTRESPPVDVAREPAPVAGAHEPAVVDVTREPAPAEVAHKSALTEAVRIEAPGIKAHPIVARSTEAPEAAAEPDFVLAPPVESHPSPAEASIEAAAPVAALSNPTTSVENQPVPPVETEAELAEKRRKRTQELILAHHRRRRARGH